MTTELSAKCTLWVNRLLFLLVAGLVFLLPGILEFYNTIRPLAQSGRTAILIGYYCCTPLVLWGLWCVDRLLKNILARQVFVTGNVRRVRHIRWCCAGVSLVCLPASFFYPPLVFLVIIMAFLTLIVSVVENALAAAVEIREENDLTV
ncbi:MAG: DUF2975 domain-containing protein [Oscillospiraceae bacterium]|nr:DUF2975 domain-containing protein [Oscillospiraceae bacterium]